MTAMASLMKTIASSARPSATSIAASRPPRVSAAAAGQHRLLLDFVADTEAFGDAGEVDAGGAALGRIRIGDRTRLDQGLLQRVGRRDVGHRRSLPDRDPDADTPQLGAAAGRELAGLFEFAHQRRRHDDQVRMLAGRDDGAQLAGGADGEVEFLTGLARIVVDDLRGPS